MHSGLDRLRFITRSYSGLQGLRMVPLGVTWLALGAMNQWGGEPTKMFVHAWQAPLTLIAMLSSYLVGRFFYLTRYGVVKLQAASLSAGWTKRSRLLVYALLVGGLALLVFGISLKPHPPFDWFVIIVALAMLVVGLDGHYRIHYMILGAMVLALGFAPGLRLISEEHFREGLDYFVVGLSLALTGIIDHLILMRLLAPTETEQRQWSS